MLRILVLIVSSISFFTLSAFAKDYPIERKMQLTISNNATTVLEFPFKIQDKSFDKFKRVTYIKKNELTKLKPNEDLDIPKFTETTKTINGKTVVVKKPIKKNSGIFSGKTANSPIKISVSKDGNIIELRPNMTGHTKAIVWGYKYYPIMIDINIVKNDDNLNDYYKFLDYMTPKKDVEKIESGRHESVIKELLKNAYLNKTPKGYSKHLFNQTEKSDFYELAHLSTISGKRYALKAYEFLNTSDKEILLNNKMFYKEGLVYAVSIEKINKKLAPQEKTRVFIVVKKES